MLVERSLLTLADALAATSFSDPAEVEVDVRLERAALAKLVARATMHFALVRRCGA